MTLADPMEKIIAAALDQAGIAYVTGEGGHNPSALDFLLTESGIEIEVKQYHSDRIGKQMARAENVIVAQGKTAVQFLADLLCLVGATTSFVAHATKEPSHDNPQTSLDPQDSATK